MLGHFHGMPCMPLYVFTTISMVSAHSDRNKAHLSAVTGLNKQVWSKKMAEKKDLEGEGIIETEKKHLIDLHCSSELLRKKDFEMFHA